MSNRNLALFYAAVIVVSLIADFFIVRSVWRAVKRPLDGSPNVPSAKYLSRQTLAGLALFFAGLSGILGATAFCIFPHPPQPLVWSVLLAALLGIFLGINSRQTRIGKTAMVVGSINTAIWLATAGAVLFFKPQANPGERAAQGPPFIALMTNAEVELVAVGDQPWSNTVCWLANGAMSDKPFPIGGGGMNSWSAGKVTKKIAFRIHNQSSFGFSFPVCRANSNPEISTGSSGLSWPVPHQDPVFAQLIACPTNTTTMNISLGIANCDWEKVITLQNQTAFNEESTGDWNATFNIVTASNEVVVVVCNYSKNTNWESRMVSVSDDGKIKTIPENATSVSGLSTGGTLLISSNEFTHIKEFQLQRRKIQWVEFRNVSLQAEHRTQVDIIGASGKIKTEATGENELDSFWELNQKKSKEHRLF